MATFSSVTGQHLLQAMAEHDDVGAEHFLAAHGFTASDDVVLVHEGRRYDARAVMAVAHRHATGRLATPEEFRSSLDQAVTILRRRGFEVVGRTTATRTTATRSPSRSAAARSPRTSTRRTTVETPPAICPTCSMTLPATGVCDYCA